MFPIEPQHSVWIQELWPAALGCSILIILRKDVTFLWVLARMYLFIRQIFIEYLICGRCRRWKQQPYRKGSYHQRTGTCRKWQWAKAEWLTITIDQVPLCGDVWWVMGWAVGACGQVMEEALLERKWHSRWTQRLGKNHPGKTGDDGIGITFLPYVRVTQHTGSD